MKPKAFEIGVDLRAGSVRQSEGVSVTNIRQTQDEVSFEAIEKALPLKGFAEGERVSVSGLADGEWTLSIDGNMVLTTNAEAFAAGVSLAGRPTPQALQAEQVKTLNHERVACESDLRTLAGARWYLFAKGVNPDDGAAVEAWVKASEGKNGYYERLVRRYANEWPGRPARLDRLVDLENRIDSARRPVLRTWRLRRQPAAKGLEALNMDG